MDDAKDASRRSRVSGHAALDELLLAPQAILEAIPDAVVAAGRDGRIVYVNEPAEELFGYARALLLGEPVQTLWPERVRELYTRNMEQLFATGQPFRFTAEASGLRHDGSEFLGEMSWGMVPTDSGPLLLAVGRDITARRTTESRLRAVAAMAARALAGADPGDLATEAVELMTSKLPAVRAAVHLADGTVLAEAGAGGELTVAIPIGAGHELRLATTPLGDEELSVTHAVANILATALERRRGEERMRHQAVHDPLTGLANRTLLRDRLDHALARSQRDGSTTGVLFIDLDNFKQVNDSHGHAAGDAVLAELGHRLRAAVRPADTVARMGGDEFVIVCEDVSTEATLALGQRLQDAIGAPLRAGPAEHAMTASIGIALGQSNAERLLAAADAAAYRAKRRAPGGVELFGEPFG